MKILFYLHNLWKLSATTKLAVDLAIGLRNKYKVNIEFAISKRVENDINSLPFKIHTLNRKGELGKALALKNLIQNNNYDIVFSYMLTQNIILSLAKFMLPKDIKTVFIGSVHNSDNYLKLNSIWKTPYRYLMKKIYENLDLIIVVSKIVEDDVNKAFFVNKSKLKVIYNYINIESIKNLAQEPLLEKEMEIFKNPVIINVGRMETQKGQEFLIKAFALIKQRIQNAKLVILGDGTLRNKLTNLAKDLNVLEDVYMLGFVNNPYKYLKYSKVFLFPSLWEGVGNVVLEAQALGIPIVAFNSRGGHVDVLKNSGILVPNKDYKSLAENAISLLENENLCNKYKNLSIENSLNYSVDKKVREYYEVFMEKLEEIKYN